jgi:putative heme-binding domain-containing protein
MTPALLLLAATAAAPPPPVTDLKLPADFTATLYADNPLCPDAYTMTIDAAGRVLVAGPGYVRALVDDDGDGIADRAVDLIDGLKDGPMGLLAEAGWLYVVCDGGLKRYAGYNGTDKLKSPPEVLLALPTSGEHDAHAVRRGPDGWLYLLCGNAAGVRKEIVTGPRSPVGEPIAGALVRLSPDFKTVEVVADGFRNPYSFDFGSGGEPFTYDSDNERCVGLPWYEGCRFYHVVPGGDYGWRSPQLSQTWRKPPYFADVVPPVCDTGRGSPTGVACYRHTHFPARYRAGFFLADWTFGRIHFVPARTTSSSAASTFELFAESVGASGFAPTALAVHPKAGELFVSIGGRGTRGGVYRIRYEKAEADPKPLEVTKRSLDFDRDSAKQWLADCGSDDAGVRRRALELIARWSDKGWGPALADAVYPNMRHADRLVRRAAGRVVHKLPVQLAGVSSPQSRITYALAQAAADPEGALKTALEVLQDETTSEEVKLEATRVIQLAFGDLTAKDAKGTVFEGYTLRKPPTEEAAKEVLESLKRLVTTHAPRVPSNKPLTNLERELARTAVALAVKDERHQRQISFWLAALAMRVDKAGDVRDDLHLLACWGRLTPRGRMDEDGPVANLLLRLETRRANQKLGADRFWPIRIDELAAALIPRHDRQTSALARHPDFVRLENLRFVKYMEPQTGTRADLVRKFLPVAAREPDSPFAPSIFEHLHLLPRQEIAPLLDTFWERQHLQESVVRVIARGPLDGDQRRLVVGLQSLDGDVVRLSAEALAKLKKSDGTPALVAAVRALRRFPDEPSNASVRTALVALLRKYTGEPIGPDAKAWAAWLVTADPATEKQLNASDGFDAAAWQKRAAAIDWAKGDIDRGRAAFTKATCAACHDGGRAVGPSLLGVGKRFGRDDLLTAILQPSKDVSPRYRPTRVATADEKAYTGIVIYDAADGVILQTGADTTVRVAGADIVSKKRVEVSLMPAGLLDKLSDAEIADLLAYLSRLGAAKPGG